MDDADRAQMLEEAERESAIAAALAHPREADAHLPWWLHLTHCTDCGAEIPPARRPLDCRVRGRLGINTEAKPRREAASA